jgi:hypothetical protein
VVVAGCGLPGLRRLRVYRVSCVCVCVCVCDSVCVAGGAHIARGTSLPIFPHFRNSGTTIDPNSPPTGGYGDTIGG